MRRPDHRRTVAEAARTRELVTRDPHAFVEAIDVAKAVGLKTVFCTLKGEHGDSDVSSFVHGDTIHVTCGQDPLEQRFAIAREIGRHVLHPVGSRERDYDPVSTISRDHRTAEQVEADAFATHMLAPDVEIRRWVRGGAPFGASLQALSKIVGVPADALVARIPL